MKPKVDVAKCIGCGTCEALCPEVFKMNDKGISEVLKAEYEKYTGPINEAVNNCPVTAISLEE